MLDAMKNFERPVLPASSGAGRTAFFPDAWRVVLLLFTLWVPVMGQTVDPYGSVLDNYLTPEIDRSSDESDVTNWTTAQWRVFDLETALKQKAEKLTQGPLATPPPPPISNRSGLLMTAALLLGATLCLRRVGELLNKRFNPWAPSSAAGAICLSKVRAEEEALSEFIRTFQLGPTAAGDSPFTGASAEQNEPVARFLAEAPQMVAELQKLLRTITATVNETIRRTKLADLHRELGGLKGAAALSELLPVWQVAAALEGLVKQLTHATANVTPSTLRTVGGGLDLLRNLCVQGLPADLLNNPPIRLLAVDDDLISRKAVSLALKKALNQPDLAEHGMAALALVTEYAYDVIFLDVQMPGMDGFELCTRIRDTVPNANTPVVFVTCHADFEARTQSTLCGGADLIAKPFLTFEITVKALTLALQVRLKNLAQCANAPAHRKVTPTTATLPAGIGSSLNSCALVSDGTVAQRPAEQRSENRPEQQPVAGSRGLKESQTGGNTARIARRPQFASIALAQTPETSGEFTPERVLHAFLNRASANLGSLRDLIQTVFRLTDEQLRQEMLADFFLRFNALVPQGVPAEMHPALQMTVALDQLLTKLVGNSKNCTSSTLLTVATALDLLIELCAARVKSDLATNPPVRFLVVDDDPVTRRAITGALQVSFDKPESVDNGEKAIALAQERKFDAIFLDVEMPGMDGFMTCLRIRETGINRVTPIVFVTGHSDFKSRSQSAVSGGSDFIAKPFLLAEIKVKALTFVLRGRLEKSRTASENAVLPQEDESSETELMAALS